MSCAQMPHFNCFLVTQFYYLFIIKGEASQHRVLSKPLHAFSEKASLSLPQSVYWYPVSVAQGRGSQHLALRWACRWSKDLHKATSPLLPSCLSQRTFHSHSLHWSSTIPCSPLVSGGTVCEGKDWGSCHFRSRESELCYISPFCISCVVHKL